jgi:hypothetical protein
MVGRYYGRVRSHKTRCGDWYRLAALRKVACTAEAGSGPTEPARLLRRFGTRKAELERAWTCLSSFRHGWRAQRPGGNLGVRRRVTVQRQRFGA